MAIGRGSMTKELFGNRQKPKKMAMGGTPTPSDMTNQRGREIADMAQSGGMKMATNAPSRITPINPATYSQGMPPMPSMNGPVRAMKKGGSVRGCGCATRGKSGAKVY